MIVLDDEFLRQLTEGLHHVPHLELRCEDRAATVTSMIAGHPAGHRLCPAGRRAAGTTVSTPVALQVVYECAGCGQRLLERRGPECILFTRRLGQAASARTAWSP